MLSFGHGSRRRLGFRRFAVLGFTVVLLAGCSLRTGPTDKPTTAEVRVEGTTPNELLLITSTDFFEQLNTATMERIPVLITSDTVSITLPYAATIDMGPLSSVYVELYQPEVETASVRMRVDLDNGEGYDQSATLSDKAALIYYFLFDEFVL